MGNREALLAGARECLLNKGYGRTTVRDIANAAGVSMAAIGYHFGSKETLLNTALVELNGKELGDEIERAIRAAGPDAGPLERFAATWDAMAESLARHRRLLTASLENFAQADHVPEVRTLLGEAHRQAVAALAEIVEATPGINATVSNDVGALYYTVLNGLMMQWIVDAENAPSGHQLANAVAALANSSGQTPGSTPASGGMAHS